MITLGTARPIALAKLNAITRDVKSRLRSVNDNTTDVKLSSPCLTLGNARVSLRTKNYRRVCTRTVFYSVICKKGCIDPANSQSGTKTRRRSRREKGMIKKFNRPLSRG